MSVYPSNGRSAYLHSAAENSDISLQAISCSKLTIKTLERDVKYVAQS